MFNRQHFLGAIILSAALGSTGFAEQHGAAATDEPMLEEPMSEELPSTDPALSGQAADDPVDEAPMGEETTSTDLIIPEQADDEVAAKTVIGTRVYNVQDEQVGRIDDLLIDGEGKVVGAVLSIGGFLGFGAKEVGIAWANLDFHPLERTARLNADIDREWLEQAPDFKSRKKIEAERQAEQLRHQQELEQERIQRQVQQQTAPLSQ